VPRRATTSSLLRRVTGPHSPRKATATSHPSSNKVTGPSMTTSPSPRRVIGPHAATSSHQGGQFCRGRQFCQGGRLAWPCTTTSPSPRKATGPHSGNCEPIVMEGNWAVHAKESNNELPAKEGNNWTPTANTTCHLMGWWSRQPRRHHVVTIDSAPLVVCCMTRLLCQFWGNKLPVTISLVDISVR